MRSVRVNASELGQRLYSIFRTRTIRPAEMFGQNVRKSLFVLDISAAQFGAKMCGRDKSSSPNISTPELFGPTKVAQDAHISARRPTNALSGPTTGLGRATQAVHASRWRGSRPGDDLMDQRYCAASTAASPCRP